VSPPPVEPVLQPPLIGGVRRSFVTAGGVRFHVTESGSRDDDAFVVFALHGWLQHHFVYRELLRNPPAGMRIIAPDLPGYGWSGAPPQGWRDERAADELLMLMDALGLTAPVLLVGHDWGGNIAYRMALRQPRRFGALLALASPHPWVAPATVLAHLWRQLRHQLLIAAAGEQLLRQTDMVGYLVAASLTNRQALTREQVAWYAERCRDRVCARTTVSTYRNFLVHELPTMLIAPERRTLKVPTLALLGLDDGVVHRSWVAAETARADEYRLELVPGAGHFIVDERPDLVRELVISLSNQVRGMSPAAAAGSSDVEPAPFTNSQPRGA